MARSSPIAPGERAPDFVAARAGGSRARFYGTVGGSPTALVFAGTRATAELEGVLVDLRDHWPMDAAIEVVTVDAAAASATGGFHDAEGRIHEAYGLDAQHGAVVVLDTNVRVAAVHGVEHIDATLASVADAVDVARHGQDALVVHQHAPVLLVRDALDGDLCRRVVDAWETGDTTETGVEASAGGGRQEVGDVRHKRRRDLTVTDTELLRALTDHVGRRVMPELAKAFAYEASRFEGFKVGCYEESSQGFFAPHRDNLSPATAHRRFALTLNLNDDYEGGELRFPEYGQQLYRPVPGEALVFSGSHLHEVLPVTRGRRFVLLSFLFGGNDRPR